METRKISGELDSLFYILANTVRGEFPIKIVIEYNPDTKYHDAIIEYITRDEYYKSGFVVDLKGITNVEGD